MADYNGDTEEDIAMNQAFTNRRYAPDEALQGIEEFVAVDYFQWGWEAAMEFVRKQND